MLGSAAMSLINVCKGASEIYSEKNIMLWDVAAGVAIVNGAGGVCHIKPGHVENSLNVAAGNPQLLDVWSVSL